MEDIWIRASVKMEIKLGENLRNNIAIIKHINKLQTVLLSDAVSSKEVQTPH